MAAGCIFTDGKYVLSGLQEKNDHLVLSGFGGKKEEADESDLHTALRETLEEFFHLNPFPADIVDYLFRRYIPRNTLKNGDYTVFVYDFADLHDFLHICKGFGVQSPLYTDFPTRLMDLILFRKIDKEAEIRQLAILPADPEFQICHHFLSDLTLLRAPKL